MNCLLNDLGDAMFDNFNISVAISVLLDHANEFNKTGSLIFNPRVEQFGGGSRYIATPEMGIFSSGSENT